MVNDELLTLYYYRDELSDTQYAAIQSALDQDPALAEHYADLCNKLDAVKINNNIQARPQAMQRWHTALTDAAKQEAKPLAESKPIGIAWFGLLLPKAPIAAAALLVLSVGIVIGINLKSTDQVVPAFTHNIDQSFARGLSAYMQEAEMQLASLESNDTSQRKLLLSDIISRNRLYIRAAQNSDSPELARVLRAFEPVLLSLINPQTAGQQFDMAKAQLAFELSAMQTKLTHDASKQTTRL